MITSKENTANAASKKEDRLLQKSYQMTRQPIFKPHVTRIFEQALDVLWRKCHCLLNMICSTSASGHLRVTALSII